MAEFEPAIAFALKHEGGLSVDPRDPGGTTNFGISARTYPDLDIRNLTLEQAKQIYLRDFWRYGGLASQRVANKALDLVVNFGQSGGGKLFQQAVSFFIAGPVVIDGVIGPQTISFANEVLEADLVRELQARAANRHAHLAAASPLDEAFLLGWLRRDVDG